MSDCLFSIIVSFYNVEKYIGECLNSVITQNFENFEIICIDDKGTDKSRSIVEKYIKKDSRIKLISNKKNIGQGESRNKAVKQARGEYIVFLDSDDCIAANMLKTLDSKIKTERPDAIFFNTDCFSDEDNIGLENVKLYYERKQEYNPQDTGINYLVTLVEQNEYRHSAWLLCTRREFLIEHNIFFEKGYLHEDVIFCLKTFCYAQKMLYIPKKLYKYRVRKSSTVNLIDTAHYNKRLKGMVVAYERTRKLLYEQSSNKKVFHAILKIMNELLKSIRSLEQKSDHANFQDEYLDYVADELRLCPSIPKERFSVDLYKRALQYELSCTSNIMIYGSGVIGKRTLKFIDLLGYKEKVFGFINSAKSDEDYCEKKKIYLIKDFNKWYKQNTLFIIAANEKNQSEILKQVDKYGIDNYIIIDDFFNKILKEYLK